MRSILRLSYGLVIGLAITGGCAASTGASHGVTYREYVGTTTVVFTNASPEQMCELHMSFEDRRDYGDNWLTPAGLPSGKSIEFQVRPGTYKATWNTCKKSATTPYYAGTATGELAIHVTQQTQLFAYTADVVVPTKRAAALGRDYQVVRFPGQAIEAIAQTAPAKVDAFAAAEAGLQGEG
nr:hypothetical protein [Deltaproteobacteria bacterium]